MNIELAKELLSFHSCRNENIDDPRWENGFLGILRPFQGELNEKNFIEIMECLKVLAPEIQKENIDKNIVSDIMNIIHFTRNWVSEGGMLTRNSKLTAEQTKYLLAWIDIIETCFIYLLEDASDIALKRPFQKIKIDFAKEDVAEKVREFSLERKKDLNEKIEY